MLERGEREPARVQRVCPPAFLPLAYNFVLIESSWLQNTHAKDLSRTVFFFATGFLADLRFPILYLRGQKMTLDLTKDQEQDQDEKFYAGSSSLYWVHVQVFIGDLFKLSRRNGV